jgi:hypothetical protein
VNFSDYKLGGRMKEGKCKIEEFEYLLDTKERYHKASINLKGFLETNDAIYNGQGGNEEVECSAEDEHKIRFEYETDCKVEVRVH